MAAPTLDLNRYLQAILRKATQMDASDIHLVAGVSPAFRIHGEIILADAPALDREQLAEMINGVLNDYQREKLEREWELCFSRTFKEVGRFRMTVYLHASSPELAIRRCSTEIPERETLALPRVVDDFARRRAGLVLVTGPTGVGKTTTMNYMIDLINSEWRCKIVTIEDPIEFVHSHKKAIVVQQELLSDVHSFSSALRHVLRQDPDVVCVGEMRDLDTIETAITAAETGHLVLATLHTPNAAQTVERIVSAFPAGQQNQMIAQLSNSLQGVVAQLLLPRANKRGRVLAVEVLIATTAVRSLIRDNNLHHLASVIQTSGRLGMKSMDASLLELYESGDISYQTALSHMMDAKLLTEKKQVLR